MMIELRKITWDNWEECMGLDVTEEQDDFIASNEYSLAQSYVALLNDERPPMTFAIYDGETLVGFMMMSYDAAGEGEYSGEPYYDIVRFMIDKNHQNKGLGKKAMTKLLEYIKSFPQGEAAAVYLSYAQNNIIARRLYESFGFVETGGLHIGDEYIATGGQYADGDDVEVVARLAL